MAIISELPEDAAELYRNTNVQDVGAGLLQPNIYHSDDYAKKKIQKMVIGGISDVVYASFEVDPNPLVLTIGYESGYNTILGFNLHYVPQQLRQAILKYVVDSNKARITNNQPMIVDYHAMKRVIPESQYVVRRYKTFLLRVVETHHLSEWPNLVTRQSRFENHWRVLKG